MTQMECVQYMEDILNQFTAVNTKLSEAVKEYAALRPKIKELSDYYASEEWKQDFSDDEAGKLPANLRRGVLSEDGIYNAMIDDRELLLQLLDVVAGTLREG